MSGPRWRRADEVLWRSTPAGVMLLPLHGDVTLVAGAAGGVWEALDTPLSADEISTAICADLAFTPETVAAAVDELATTGLIVAA